MIVLERPIIIDGQQSRHVVALFGMGLIGRAIATSLAHLSQWTSKELAFSWDDPNKRLFQRAEIVQFLEGAMPSSEQEKASVVKRFDFVWAAGKAGFTSSQADVEQELDAFKDVLAMSNYLYQRAPLEQHAFHVLSSAGGLFEGQRHIHQKSSPAPRRPYGALKLAQEGLLTHNPPDIKSLIYRPSSVYGFSGTGLRVGLVSALIQNAIRHRISPIFGELHTIRDYVLASDIGSFVAKQITAPSTEQKTYLLASGKPSSMFEMLYRIERAIGRKLYRQLEPQPYNASHISICRSALPNEWRPTDLDTGIRRTALQLRGAFIRSE